jgi:hypothetical protein
MCIIFYTIKENYQENTPTPSIRHVLFELRFVLYIYRGYNKEKKKTDPYKDR